MAKIGDIRYWACVDDETRRVTYSEWVLRSIQNRGGVLTGYWVSKVNGLSWGKRSKKVGDYGFLDNIPSHCRSSFPIDKLPYSASKAGALAQCIKAINMWIRIHGADAEESLFDDLKIAKRAQKRIRAKNSKAKYNDDRI